MVVKQVITPGRPPWRIDGLPERHVMAFLRDTFQRDKRGQVRACDLRIAYLNWCASFDLASMSEKRLASILSALGFAQYRVTAGRGWRGLRRRGRSVTG